MNGGRGLGDESDVRSRDSTLDNSDYSAILSRFDPPGSFDEETWLYKPKDKEPAHQQRSSPSQLHDKLARYFDEPDIQIVRRNLLLCIEEQSKKELQPNSSWNESVRQQAKQPSTEDDDVRRPVLMPTSPCLVENQRANEENHQMHDITDIEIAAKMQEEYLQRSVLQLAKRLAADECQNTSQDATPQASNTNYRKLSKTARFNKPGRSYGIRSNTQTLRVSPTNNMVQSTPLRTPVKYAGRSTTQTLRVSPIAPCSHRTLSVPRSTGANQNGRSPSRGKPPASQRKYAVSPQISTKPPKESSENVAPETHNERISRINASNAYIRTVPTRGGTSQRSLSSGPPQMKPNPAEPRSRLPSTSRLAVARNNPPPLSTNFSQAKSQQRTVPATDKTKPQGANIIRYVVGGGATQQNGNSRQAKPSLLPRPRGSNLPRRQLNVEQFTNI